MKSNNDAKTVKRNLANFVLKIWESGDGCPKTLKSIIIQFEALYNTYQKYLKEGRGTKSHKKKLSTSPPLRPTWKSRRLCGEQSISSVEPGDDAMESESPETPETVKNSTPAPKYTSKRLASNHQYKDEWIEDHGSKLFRPTV